MSTIEKTTALGAYFAALGISSERAAYCLPILTGEKPLPTEAEIVVAETAKTAAEAKTLNLTEAAKIAGVSRSTLWRVVKSGGLPTVRIRGRNRVRLADLVALTQKGKAA